MKPGKIDGANFNLSKPQDWQDKLGDCGDLWVRVDNERQTMTSAWYPTEEEKAAIARGAPIVLSVWGAGHPPVALTTGDVP